MSDFFGEFIPIVVVFALGAWALRRNRRDNLDGMPGHFPDPPSHVRIILSPDDAERDWYGS